MSRAEMIAEMRGARVLIFPSELYEGMPMSIVEAFACGVPLIAARLGAMTEMIEEGTTGIFFDPADADGLARQIRWAFSHDSEMAAMGQAARAEYLARYTAASNCPQLIAIYEQAISEQQRRENRVT